MRCTRVPHRSRCAHVYLAATTSERCSPSPSMPTRMTLPGLRKTGVGLDPGADAGRGAGADDVAGQERHVAAEMAHQVRDAEDHGPGRAVLEAPAVDVQPHGQVLRVRDLVPGDQPRADRGEGLRALAFDPLLARIAELVVALRDVVDDAVAGDVIQGVGLVDIGGASADHHAELDLPVALDRAARQPDLIVRPDDRAGVLHEHDRLRGDRRVGLARVIGVVEADAHEIRHMGERAPEARRARGERQARRIEAAPAA